MIKAELVKVKAHNEYFVIKIHNAKMNAESGSLEGMPVILQLPEYHYDWLEDPEALLSSIVEAINKEK